MFKNFTPADSISGKTQLKTSVKRQIRKALLDKYPTLETDVDVILPKKRAVFLVKCADKISLLVSAGTPWFFQIRDGPWLPHLRTLHRYPNLLPKVGVDRGAIKFVMAGAKIMCPGLTSKGGDLSVQVDKNTPVAVMAEGKQHALAIGMTVMSTADMKTINANVGVDNLHYLGDGLWGLKEVD